VGLSSGSPSGRSGDSFSSLSPLQSLATVFWSVHDPNNGNQLLQSVLSLRQVTDEDPSAGTTSDHASRSSKLSRLNSISSKGGDSGAFEQLRQIKRCPTSMARLISDLLDERCTSIDEVKRELADMASTPELFLFDPDAGFSSKNLSFGGKGRHYGQASEVKRVLQIANRTVSIQDPTRVAEISSEARRGRACQVDSIFISGAAGSGKSSLATHVADFLSSQLNWLTATVKFKNNAGHESGRLVFSLFDKLVKEIVAVDQKKESGEGNFEYSSIVSRAILDAFDVSSLTSLRGMLPGLNELLSNLGTCYAPLQVNNENEMSRFRMTFLLSKLLAVILSTGRDVFLIMDDIQWCELGALELVSHTLVRVLGARGDDILVALFVHGHATGDAFVALLPEAPHKVAAVGAERRLLEKACHEAVPMHNVLFPALHSPHALIHGDVLLDECSFRCAGRRRGGGGARTGRREFAPLRGVCVGGLR